MLVKNHHRYLIPIVRHGYLHVIVPGALHHQPLQVVVGGELGQGQQPLHADRLVHLGHLLQQPEGGNYKL